MSDVCALDDLADESATKFTVDLGPGVGAVPVSVVRIGDDMYAIGDVCSHANVLLSEGDVWCDELELECPKHASAFSLTTGEPVTLPATQPVPVFDATVVGGRVHLTVRDDTGDAANGGTR